MAKPDVLATLGLNISQFTKGWQDAQKEIDAFSTKTGVGLTKSEKAVYGLNLGLRQIAASIGIIGIAKFIGDTIQFGAALKETSREAMISAETLQRMQAAFKGKLPIEDTNAVLLKFADLIRDARQGSADAQQELASFGATANDTADSALLKYADKMKALGDSTQAADLSAKLFGNTLGSKVRSAASIGGDAIKAAGDKAKVAGDDFLTANEKFSKMLGGMADSAKQWVLNIGSGIDEVAAIFGELSSGAGFTFTKGKSPVKELNKDAAEGNAILERTIELNQERERQIQGAIGEEIVMQKEINLLLAEYNNALKNSPDDKKRLSEMQAEISAKQRSLRISEQQREDEERALQASIDEVGLRLKGQNTLADKVAITAKYENEILKALREQNTAKAELLKMQKEQELNAAKIAEHDKTPRQRAAERRKARSDARKIRQQDARDAEQLRRTEGGLPEDRLRFGYAANPVNNPTKDWAGGSGTGVDNLKRDYRVNRGVGGRMANESLAKRDLAASSASAEEAARASATADAAARAKLYADVASINDKLSN